MKYLTRLMLVCGLLAWVPTVMAETEKKPVHKASSEADDDKDPPVHKASKKTVHKPKQDDADDEPAPKKTLKKANKPKEDGDTDTDKDNDKPAPAKADKTEKKKADEAAPPSASHPAAVSSLNPDDIEGFSSFPKKVRSLVESSLALTHLGLAYTFGGSNPSEGGMDCSGTIYHVLRFQGLKDVPRQSDEMCAWVRDHSQLHVTTAAHSLEDADFAAMRPGDLLFWTGTYKTDRKLPITHVMLYMGKLKKNGKPVVFGASDGRYYAGERRSGVSVFDLSLPRSESEAVLYGYGSVPGLMPPAPPQELASKEPIEPAKEKAGEGETILPAIVVPTPNKNEHFAKDEEIVVKEKRKPEASDEDKPVVAKKLTAAKPHADEGEKAPAKHKSDESDVKELKVAAKTAPAKTSHSDKTDVDNDDKPAPTKKKADGDEPQLTKKPSPDSKPRSLAASKPDTDEDDKAPAPKPKSSGTKKASGSGTSQKHKPQPSPGRVALDQTTEAVKKAAESVRSVFE